MVSARRNERRKTVLLILRGRPVANVQAVETQSAATYPPERPLSGYSIRSTDDGSWLGRAAGGRYRRPLARHDPEGANDERPVSGIGNYSDAGQFTCLARLHRSGPEDCLSESREGALMDVGRAVRHVG